MYLYEIDGKEGQAIELAATTNEECGSQLEHNEKDALGEAQTILQLLRENVAMWRANAGIAGKA